MKSLLIELLTEELPPKALKKLGEAFAEGIAHGLRARKLIGDSSISTAFATPRRLAVHISNVVATSPDEVRRDKVLPVSVAFNAEGKPTPPLLKKLAAMGLDEAALAKFERAMDGKAEALFHNYTAAGKPLADVLQEVLTDAIAKLPIPKVMFYERDDGTAVNFVRPAHGLMALYGKEVLAVSALGLKAGNTTRGHRFHSEGMVTIADADSYESALRQAKVIVSYAERRAMIAQQLEALAKGDDLIAPDALLDEVNSLVEWPTVYECHFEKEFLQVPQECLILTMQTNQKYFATQKSSKLTNRFLIVSNIQTKDPSLIISGNERVVRPRLADAKFFFDQDRKQTLASRLPKLANVVYHGKLGSQAERNVRVVNIAKSMARTLGADEAKIERAARLCKADLLTDMVGEFPELQGVMGTYYALHDKEDAEVAKAITEHYQPKFAGDFLPKTVTGTVLALADKLETVVGMFAIGALPTGDKDPFGLRRHAIGILRILIEKQVREKGEGRGVSFVAIINAALYEFPIDVRGAEGKAIKDKQFAIKQFLFDRMAVMQQDAGFTAQEIASVLDLPGLETALEVPKRLAAVRAFSKLHESPALAAANKRISNILKKSDAVPGEVNAALLQEDAEKHLFGALQTVKPIAEKLFANHEYAASLRELATLREPVDTFFDKVMVNAEDPALRANRLALLQSLHDAMNRVADLSKLAS
jgi:glycyl-tRNA synthetase beta chain